MLIQARLSLVVYMLIELRLSWVVYISIQLVSSWVGYMLLQLRFSWVVNMLIQLLLSWLLYIDKITVVMGGLQVNGGIEHGGIVRCLIDRPTKKNLF